MNEFVLYALLAVSCVSLLLVILLLSKSNNGQGLQNEMAILQSKIAQLEHSIKTDFSLNRTETNNTLQSGLDGLIQKTDANHKLNRDDLRTGLIDLTQELKNKFTDLTEGQSKLVQQTEKKLEQMRETVDEKLQKKLSERLGQSFEAVGKQLEAVQLGLGEMKTLAGDVGGLKKVLSNVKMRGGIGEVQLAMLLEQILAPEQYAANVKTKQNSADIVEFAIKLPGRDDNNKQVWLPIDAKFPKDVYEQLQTAYDASDLPEIEAAQKNLEQTIKKMAKDISDKYLDPPNTTDFAILFLPFEGIYAEVVRKASLLEDLQRNYKIIVTGPSTLAAILNSLQMGFKTLAIQKRSGEVWKVLGNVKTEFEKFGGLIEKAQGNIQNGLKQLDEVVGVRTRAIQRQLRDVEVLNDAPGALNALENPELPID
ncbi:MAG: DNA recombination protein RmuC [Bacteroidetes bacterium]|nr:DNA recombination protein RmuC [Bacteroidota bacterium]